MISFLIFLFILSIIIIAHEFGHFIVAKKIGVRIEKFSLGFGPRLLEKEKNGTQYCISAIPLGGYVKLAGDNLEEYKGDPDEYFSKPPGKRFWIIFTGPLLNYILGFFCFWLVLFWGYPMLTTKVGGLLDGYGAKEAGIQLGDKITAVDGKKVEFWEDLQKMIQGKRASAKVRLAFLRDNKEFTVEVQIKEKKLADKLGRKRTVGLLGISPAGEIVKVRHGILQSFFLGIKRTLGLTLLTYRSLWSMITGELSVRDSVTGPLGIFFITSQVASMGVIALLHLIAVLSISLTIFNLLPLPVLDGGHILLLGIEKIRGRYLSLKTERIITQVGITVLVSLAILITYNDILRIFGDKIQRFLK
jgi:regulator of sigma E protease